MSSSLLSEWQRLTEEISKYHDLPTFLPSDFITSTLLPTIFAVTVILTITYLIIFQLMRGILPEDISPLKRSKACYQATNFLFNVVISAVGVYLEYWVLPTLDAFRGTSLDRITGYHEELYLVSALQLGYQFWALPVGVLYVNENTEMIMHHLAVVISTSLSGFLTVGFRYYTPFFYGVFELSSLPLAMMNTFKDNPKLLKTYPKTYLAIRVAFAVSFLWIRIVMDAWRWPPFLRDNLIYLYTAEMGLFKVYLLAQWSLAAFLAFIQHFWAAKILQGILKILGIGKKSEKKKES